MRVHNLTHRHICKSVHTVFLFSMLSMLSEQGSEKLRNVEIWHYIYKISISKECNQSNEMKFMLSILFKFLVLNCDRERNRTHMWIVERYGSVVKLFPLLNRHQSMCVCVSVGCLLSAVISSLCQWIKYILYSV